MGKDIQACEGGGIGNIIKSGLNMFFGGSNTSITQQRALSSYPVVVLFVVGGVTAVELKDCREEVEGRKKRGERVPAVYIGSSELTTPGRLAYRLFEPAIAEAFGE
eukprot:GDKI01042371.1.p1 GENE.GDKI01042371.1~~GDKI01042371.1.p1  ORF type:complete len:106 (-),score=32.46 GDKI01042371.1:69-386(-)